MKPGGECTSACPHLTGGAVDLILCAKDGTELPMGTAVHAGRVESHGACATDAPNVAPDARPRPAHTALGTVGGRTGQTSHRVVALSYGDPSWCYRTVASAACYGPILKLP
jgi:D-alanyl-D-alanine dipeptidase